MNKIIAVLLIIGALLGMDTTARAQSAVKCRAFVGADGAQLASEYAAAALDVAYIERITQTWSNLIAPPDGREYQVCVHGAQDPARMDCDVLGIAMRNHAAWWEPLARELCAIELG
jgi:hypothetical protein